jgi:hypothetical protein
MSISLKWYDLWIGAYWDRKNRVLYLCPLPMIVIAITSTQGLKKGPT